MDLDVRLPIGLMFSIVGALLTVYGSMTDAAVYERSLGININLRWGIVLLLFGLAMLMLAWRGSRSPRAHAPGESSASGDRRPAH